MCKVLIHLTALGYRLIELVDMEIIITSRNDFIEMALSYYVLAFMCIYS